MNTLLWMAYVAGVGLLASGAAYVIEPVVRALRWPTRPLWALALAAQLVVVAWALGTPDTGRPAAWLAIPWALATAAAVAVYLRALRTLRRERGSWRVTIADEMPVWVSERTGPAVVGFLRSIVVAPAWALALGDRERRLLLRHEAEHVAAWDPTLLLGGLLTCALVPWSPAAWWALSRLRLAIEVDCDRRVLRAEPDVATYGELLVAVQGRVVPGAAGIAAFAERRMPLEERLEAMTARRPRGAAWRWSARGAVASALVVGACIAPAPGAIRERSPAMRIGGDSAPARPQGLTITGGSMMSRFNPDGTQTLLTPHASIHSESGSTTIDMGPEARAAWVAESLKSWPTFEAQRARSNDRRTRVIDAVRAHLARPAATTVGDSVLVSVVLDPSYGIVAEAREPLRNRGVISGVLPEEMQTRFPTLAASRSEASGGIEGASVGLPRSSAVRYWQLEASERVGTRALPLERENAFAALRTHFARRGAEPLTDHTIAYVVLDPSNRVVAEGRETVTRMPDSLTVRPVDMYRRFPNLPKSLEVMGTGMVDGRTIGAAPKAVVLYWTLGESPADAPYRNDAQAHAAQEAKGRLLAQIMRTYFARPDVADPAPRTIVFLAIDADGRVIGDVREPRGDRADGSHSVNVTPEVIRRVFPALPRDVPRHSGVSDAASIGLRGVDATIVYEHLQAADDPQETAMRHAIAQLFDARGGPPRDTAVGVVAAFGASWRLIEVRRVPVAEVPTFTSVRPSVREQLLPSLRGRDVGIEGVTTGEGRWGLAAGSVVHLWKLDDSRASEPDSLDDAAAASSAQAARHARTVGGDRVRRGARAGAAAHGRLRGTEGHALPAGSTIGWAQRSPPRVTKVVPPRR